MGQLVSASQLNALRKVAESGMNVDVTRLKQTKVDSVYGDEQDITYVVDWTTSGWLRAVPEGVIDVVSGVTGDIGTFRLFLPVGTDLDNGDRVLIEGRTYTVTDTNVESTYQVVLRCSLRRLD
jgi:hypothetical protein